MCHEMICSDRTLTIKINNDLTLLDTPGIVYSGDLITKLPEEVVKHINIKHLYINGIRL